MAGNCVERISPEEAWRIQKSGALLLDVRTHEEVAQGGFPEASHIPHDLILCEQAMVEWQTSDPIVIFCKVGGRAQMVGEFLVQQGFEKVYNAGGFDDLKSTREGDTHA